ncbi:hypothetical protein M3P21_10940 [Ruegeria sp. 2012CJ41-6]|uniref:CTP synthetase n=1 Tax=Ruegeria spongiae TaxID=2942209 RepID=A0ABT0Q2J2_9RHOB|nr:hypothetical protein [Ruegeria spongiae]MCL6284045.1 hypothetical protein [Ruegeria spongiae]
MLRLAFALFTLVSSALAGTGVIIVLSMGAVSLSAILGAAAVGFVLAIPATWLIAKRIYTATSG